ncbi:MAG: helix-turn-helix domain-containing protein [Firmicutes bacterium]|nr:helix-turn-helix domain-containing protein [Bacillota bacterium]
MKNRVQAVREEKGLSKSELARRSGVALSFINYIETGQKSPTLRTLEKLAKAMDVPVTELLDKGLPAKASGE